MSPICPGELRFESQFLNQVSPKSPRLEDIGIESVECLHSQSDRPDSARRLVYDALQEFQNMVELLG